MSEQPKGYEQALGAVPWQEGMEPAEVIIDWLREERKWSDECYAKLLVTTMALTDTRDALAAERQAREAAEANAATLSAAHLERCEKVRELQVECDALHKKAADWSRVARDNQQMAIEYEARAEAAEANAARLRALLELATNDQETYDYRRGYDSGYASGQAAQRAVLGLAA